MDQHLMTLFFSMYVTKYTIADYLIVSTSKAVQKGIRNI